MRCASSTPASAIEAFSKDLKPVIDAHRRLIARWSCSTMLLRYLQVRTSNLRQIGCSPRSRHSAPARHMAIDGVLPRSTWVRSECSAEERLRRGDAAVGSQQKVDRLALLVDGAIQVVPAP